MASDALEDLEVHLKKTDDIESVKSSFLTNTIFGHDSNLTFLSDFRKAKQRHHALLFSGSKGIGKETIAFNLAYSILSNNDVFSALPEQRIEDRIWRQMVQDIHPNFLYIGQKSSDQTTKKIIAVDDIRNITSFFQLISPDTPNIVLVDSIDRLTQQAANALLKILEEPPSKSLFLLINHNSKPVLSTLKSRCITINFSNLNKSCITSVLGMCLSGGFDSSKCNDLFFYRAKGSVRKAAKLYLHNSIENYNNLKAILEKDILNFERLHELTQNHFSELFEDLFDIIYEKVLAFTEEDKLNIANELVMLRQKLQMHLLDAQELNIDQKQLFLTSVTKLHELLKSL